MTGSETLRRDAEASLFYRISPEMTMGKAKEVVRLPQQVETSDIFLGAYFLASGGRLSGVQFDERETALFRIEGHGIEELDHEYKAGKALVNPVVLRASLNYLRDVLFEMQRRRGNDRAGTNRRGEARR